MKLTCYQCASCNSISDPQENDTLPEYWTNVKFTKKIKGMCGLSDEVTEVDVCSRQCLVSYLGYEFDLKVE